MSRLGSLLGSVEQIELMIQKKFSAKCDPTSLNNAISKEVSRNKQKNSTVPNDFTLILGEVDFQRLSSARIIKSLYESVERQIIRENSFIDGKLHIKLEKSIEGSGLIKIISTNSTGDTGKFSKLLDNRNDEDDSQDTLIVEKKTLQTLRNLPVNFSDATEHEIAKLVDTTEPHKIEFTLTGKDIYIGRKEICDLTLTDSSVSRIHASLIYERHRHMIRDENSHNGIYINGKKLDTAGIYLQNNDLIQLGNSVLKYQVL